MRLKDRGCAALVVAMGLCVPGAAQAATASQLFATPGEHAFVVPPAVTSVSMMLVGGSGGAGAHGTIGGAGATEVATLAVTPGETLYAEVGGDGAAGDPNDPAGGDGGANGGGTGGEQFVIFVTPPSGGGGGGASDVRTVPACPSSNPALLVTRRLVRLTTRRCRWWWRRGRRLPGKRCGVRRPRRSR